MWRRFLQPTSPCSKHQLTLKDHDHSTCNWDACPRNLNQQMGKLLFNEWRSFLKSVTISWNMWRNPDIKKCKSAIVGAFSEYCVPRNSVDTLSDKWHMLDMRQMTMAVWSIWRIQIHWMKTPFHYWSLFLIFFSKIILHLLIWCRCWCCVKARSALLLASVRCDITSAPQLSTLHQQRATVGWCHTHATSRAPVMQ